MSLSISYADTKVFYDPVSGKEIVDVSGKKTKEQIKKEFNLTEVKEASLAKNDGYRIKNGEIEKYDRKAESDAKRAEKELARQAKETAIKQKLNLSDEDFKNLKEALKK